MTYAGYKPPHPYGPEFADTDVGFIQRLIEFKATKLQIRAAANYSPLSGISPEDRENYAPVTVVVPIRGATSFSSNDLNPSDDMVGSTVYLVAKDLSLGYIRAESRQTLGEARDDDARKGVWHLSIIAFGMEYELGARIDASRVSENIVNELKMTATPISEEADAPCSVKHFKAYKCLVGKSVFERYIEALRGDRFYPGEYNLFNNNCVDFAADVLWFLCRKTVPEFYRSQVESIRLLGYTGAVDWVATMIGNAEKMRMRTTKRAYSDQVVLAGSNTPAIDELGMRHTMALMRECVRSQLIYQMGVSPDDADIYMARLMPTPPEAIAEESAQRLLVSEADSSSAASVSIAPPVTVQAEEQKDSCMLQVEETSKAAATAMSDEHHHVFETDASARDPIENTSILEAAAAELNTK